MAAVNRTIRRVGSPSAILVTLALCTWLAGCNKAKEDSAVQESHSQAQDAVDLGAETSWARLERAAGQARQNGDTDSLWKIADHALALMESTLATNESEPATCVLRLAEIYLDHPGGAPIAQHIYETALPVLERVVGSASELTITFVDRLGRLRFGLGNRAFGMGASLGNLVFLDIADQEFAVADSLYRRAISLGQADPGGMGGSLGESLLDRAILLTRKADLVKHLATMSYVSAREFDGETIQKLFSLREPERLALARRIYSDAEAVFKQALSVLERSPGKNGYDAVGCLNAMASLYERLGESAQAQAVRSRAHSLQAK